MSRSGQKNDLYASALRIGKSENPPLFFYRIGAAFDSKIGRPRHSLKERAYKILFLLNRIIAKRAQGAPDTRYARVITRRE